MPEMLEDTKALESTTVGIYRTATVVKGGRRFSFSSLVVMGDRNGSVGLGYGKSRNVPTAIEKAEKSARKSQKRYTLKGGTIPHPVIGKFGASLIKLIPASPGTGVIAGGTVRAVLEMVGVHDCLTKSYGSTNQKNLCRATIDGLKQLSSRERIAQLRGVTISTSVVDEILEAGKVHDTTAGSSESTVKAKGPVNLVGKQQKSGGRGRGRRGQGGGQSRGAPPLQVQEKPKTEAAPPPSGADSAAGQSGDQQS